MNPGSKMLNFSMYQSGIDFNVPIQTVPLTSLIGSWQGLFSGT
jgi:hypothetical protein